MDEPRGLEQVGDLSALLWWCRTAGIDAAKARVVDLDEFDREMILPCADGRFLVVSAT